MNKGMYSSDRPDWETPQDFFDRLDRIYEFTLDVCATDENTKCDQYLTPEIDGLSQSWAGEVCWLNPPYGREIGKWVEKAYSETKNGNCKVVALLPARTDTKWWHRYVMKAATIGLVKGRLSFVGGESAAPFPSAVAFFRKHDKVVPEFFSMER